MAGISSFLVSEYICDSSMIGYDIIFLKLFRYLAGRGEAHSPLHTASHTQKRSVSAFLFWLILFYDLSTDVLFSIFFSKIVFLLKII